MKRAAQATGMALLAPACATSPGCRASEKGDADASPPLYYASATKMVELMRGGLSSVELMKAQIARVREVNGKVNAVMHLAEDQALAAAKQAEKAIRDHQVDWDRQPFFGVPFCVKNCLDVKGFATTAGAPSRLAQIAEQDTPEVRRLKRAGGIPLVTTSVPLLCGTHEAENLIIGRTNNPYKFDRTAGNCGTGALIAAGGSPLGIASDDMGPIRMVAHWCGVAGLCPAPRRTTMTGFFPPIKNERPFYWSIGPIARTVDDLELAAAVMMQPDPGDASSSVRYPIRASRDVDLGSLRIAYATRWGHERGVPTREVQDGVEKSANLLAKRGARVEQTQPKLFDKTLDIGDAVPYYDDPIQKLDIGAIRKMLKRYGAEGDPQWGAGIDYLIRRAHEMTPERVKTLVAEIPKYQADVLSFMDAFDAFLLPVTATPAPRHRTSLADAHIADGLNYPCMSSLVDSLPSGTVRVGISPGGLPIGIQVVGRAFREDIVLGILRELEVAYGGWTPSELL